MIHQWKKALLEGTADIFVRGGKKAQEADEDTMRSVRKKIGELALSTISCPECSSLGPAGEWPNQFWCADITYMPCAAASFIWLPSWTGTPGRYWPGGYPTRWKPTSGSKR